MGVLWSYALVLDSTSPNACRPAMCMIPPPAIMRCMRSADGHGFNSVPGEYPNGEDSRDLTSVLATANHSSPRSRWSTPSKTPGHTLEGKDSNGEVMLMGCIFGELKNPGDGLHHHRPGVKLSGSGEKASQ